MEFSETIDWNKLDNDAQKFDWCLTEELYEKFSLKPSLCERVVTLGIKGDVVEQLEEDVYPPIPESRIPFPRISDISLEDQKYFMQTYKEYASGKEINAEGINQLENLIWTLTPEQDEFSMFLQQHSLSLKNDYNFVHPNVKESVQKLLGDQRARILQCLPPCYTLFQTVGLSIGAVFPNDPILCFLRTLKQDVEQPLLSLPNLEENKRLRLDNGEDEDVVFQTELCKDSTACQLSSEHDVHFVLTAEALQSLIDNQQPDYDKEWELPVTVVDHSNDCTESTSSCSKTIMIDCPLPPKSMTPREMNVMYYKREVSRVLKNISNNSDKASTPPHSSSNMAQEENKNNVSLANNLKAEHKPSNFETLLRNLPTMIEGSSDELSTKTENICQKDKDTNLPNTRSSPSGNDEPLGSNSLTTDDKKNQKNKKSVPFSYSIWTFGNLKLLVRATNCGLLYQRNKEGKGCLRPVNVHAKPEYQLMFGYEKITSSEVSRWWMDSYLNPDSLCVCARIDPVSSELVRVDVLSQSALINMSSFNPAQPMKMVHNILTRLEKLLEPGTYILSHSPGDMHMCIYELVSKEGTDEGKKASYDLHASYSRDNEFLVYYEKVVPWVSIDPNIFQEWHIAHGRIPMTFPALPSEELKKVKSGKKKKKKKKKKGMKNNQKKKSTEKGPEHHTVHPKVNVYLKRLRSGDQITYDNPDNDFIQKNEDNFVPLETAIAERLRSRSTPVTYDDLEFNF